MPLFDYHCSECAITFEQLVRSARSKVVCARCDGRAQRLSVSRFAVRGESPFAPMIGHPGENWYSSGCGLIHRTADEIAQKHLHRP